MRAFTARQGAWVRTLLAWLLPVTACWLQWVFWDQLGGFPWLLLYPSVFFAARIGGLWGGIGATVLASLLAWWLFLPPAFSFAVDQIGSPLVVTVFFATGIAFSLFDQALRTMRLQNRLLFERAGDGIVRVSREGVFLDANSRFAELVGRERREIIGLRVADLVADMTPQLWEDLDRRLQPDGSLVNEHLLRRGDGTLLPVEVTATVLPGGDHLAMVHDISRRKQAEAALQASEEKWRLVFDLLPVGVSVVDSRQNVTDTNPALAQILGLSEQGILAGTYRGRRYFHPDHSLMASGEFPSLRAIREQQVIRNVEIGVEKEDGEIVWTTVSATPVMGSGYSATVTVDISERKRVELALRASEEKFSTVFRSSPIALSISHMDTGELLDINDSYTRVFGYARDDVIGRTSMQLGLFSPEERNAAVQILQERGEAFNVPFSVHCKSGEVKECLSSIVIVDLPPDRYLLSSIVDISDLKRLDAAVRASEERLRWALDASNEGLWDWNIVTGEVFGNDQWFRFFGYEPGEAPANVNLWSDSLHPDDAPGVLRILDDYLQGRRPDYRSEHRTIVKSGAIRWSLSVGKVVSRDEAGRPVRMVGTDTDITAAKVAELQLRDSEERFRLIVQNSPAPILIWDESAAIRYASPAFAAVFGVTGEQLLTAAAALQAATVRLDDAALTKEGLLELGNITEAEAARWVQVLRAVRRCARRPGDKVQVDINVLTDSGAVRDLHIVFQGFQTSSSHVEIVSVVHDITEHRALAHLLQEANSELERQVAVRTAELQETVAALRQANLGKDAFLAAISHELRTPLTGVLSMGELLASQERGPLNPDQVRYVDAITDSGERLLATVNSVLLYTNLMAGNTPIRREPCDLEALFAVGVRALHVEAQRKQLRVVQEITPPDLAIESDAQGIIHIIKILLSNAVKFTPAGGRIDLGARLCSREAQGKAWVEIAVEDTGVGMSAEQLERLYRPFVQGDQTLARRFEGLGLGLAYVQRMVELLGGEIGVESEVGKGSRFRVLLPVGEV